MRISTPASAALRAAPGLQFSIFSFSQEVTSEVRLLLVVLFLCFTKDSNAGAALGVSERAKGQTWGIQGPSLGKTPGRGRSLPLEDLSYGSFHLCCRTPPFLVLYSTGSAPLQMKMELPVASQETGRCGFTLAQQEFLPSSLDIQH